MKVSWTQLKTHITAKGINPQYLDLGDSYWVKFVDGAFDMECFIDKDPTDTTNLDDFEDNYKDLCNKQVDKIQADGISKVALYEAEGDFYSKVSHNLCDKTTWFQKSTRVTAETLTLDTGYKYDFANANIIDLTHGKITREDDYTDYMLTVYDNAVEQTSGFTVDYDNGSVTFDSAPTGPVTADYSYENGSCYSLVPSSGKTLMLRHAELQFTKDVQMTQINFEVWVYNPYDLPNKVPYEVVKYKNVKDVINIANLGQGYIPAFDTIQNDVLVFPFNYARPIRLQSSVGAELRISIDSEVPFVGEFATITFYTIEVDE